MGAEGGGQMKGRGEHILTYFAWKLNQSFNFVVTFLLRYDFIKSNWDKFNVFVHLKSTNIVFELKYRFILKY